MLVSNGTVKFASEDHKPSNEKESKRIYDAGGHVQIGRVNGNLAVSRALGDFVYKDTPHLPEHAQKVSAEADITIFERSAEDEFIVLACDGIWDVVSCDNVRDFVTDHLKAGLAPEVICERLLDHCLGRDSKDNMTVVIVLFENAPKQVEGFAVPDIAVYAPPLPTDDDNGPPVRNVMDILELLRARGAIEVQEGDDDMYEDDEDDDEHGHSHGDGEDHGHSHDGDDHGHSHGDDNDEEHGHGSGSSITEID